MTRWRYCYNFYEIGDFKRNFFMFDSRHVVKAYMKKFERYSYVEFLDVRVCM